MPNTRVDSGDMLIAAPTRWDEACFAVPAVRALAHSGLRVGVLCPEIQRPFWETLNGPAVIAFSETTKAKTLAPRLAGRWEAFITWEPGVAAEAASRAAIPRRLGPEGKPLRKLLTHPVGGLTTSGPPTHRVRDFLGLVEALGLDTARPEFFRPVDLAIKPEAGTVLLCPDSDYGRTYEWPLERWLETARALLASQRRVTIASITGGAGLGTALATTLGGDIPCVEAAPLTSVLPLLAVHPVVIAADGSLPHLAAHVGTVCVTLFGPGDPNWRRPLGRRHSTVSRSAECSPCLLSKCPLDLRCQTELSAAPVWEAMRQAFDLTDTP
jgi:ADP-heptose:LPS heptosyltransferase